MRSIGALELGESVTVSSQRLQRNHEGPWLSYHVSYVGRWGALDLALDFRYPRLGVYHECIFLCCIFLYLWNMPIFETASYTLLETYLSIDGSMPKWAFDGAD